MSDLQRDIDLCRERMFGGSDEQFAAWQRIREELTELQAELGATIDQRDALDLEVQRLNKLLTPDRERVARKLAVRFEGDESAWPQWVEVTDAAIAAMEGKDDHA